jgi:hypothetical protein
MFSPNHFPVVRPRESRRTYIRRRVFVGLAAVTLVATPWLTSPQSSAQAAPTTSEPVKAAASMAETSAAPRIQAGKGPKPTPAIALGSVVAATTKAIVVSRPLTPDQFLANPNLTISENARADVLSGNIDQRLLAVLAKALETHRLEVTTLQTGHSKYVKGTNKVSNHVAGRGADIAVVDGRDVSTSNTAAKTLMAEMQTYSDAIRPTEIGGPWDIDGAEGVGFTNHGHRDHVHVGFDD